MIWQEKINLFFKGIVRIVFLLRELQIGKIEFIFKVFDYGRFLNIYIRFELKEFREMRIIFVFCGEILKWRNVELKVNSIICFN